MTLTQLRYFLSAARHGSFAGAADELLLKQPSVAEQIRALEAELGVPLFARTRRKLTLTPAGEALRPYAEHLITFGKRGDLHARRQVLKRLNDKSVVHTLFAEIGPRYVDRPGGYTRILKLGNRKGDNAPMAIIELVEALEEELSERTVGFRIDDEDLEDLKTVRDAVDYFVGRL